MICPKCFYCVNHAQDPNIIICTQCGTTLSDEPDDILLHGKYGITTETRPSQAKLSNEINELMIRSNDALLFAEGGTGIGKSFAYLIPAIIKNERVVISTAKKSLQRQLVDKDIPYLLGKMGITRSYGLFKGTANYACVKLEKGIKDPEERQKFHAWIQECVKNKVPADKSNWPGTEPIWWSDISAENCLKGINCSYYAHCRPHPQNIQILVVNHSILAIDFFLGLTTKHLLGKYQTVVIDEAHQAIEMFRSALSLKLTDQMIHSAIRRFKKDEGLHKAVDYLLTETRAQDIENTLNNLESTYNQIKNILHCTSNNYVAVTDTKRIAPLIYSAFSAAQEAYVPIELLSKKLFTTCEDRKVQTALGGEEELDRIRYVLNLEQKGLARIENVLYKMLKEPDINATVPKLTNPPYLDTELLLTTNNTSLAIQPITIGKYVEPALRSIPYKILVSATLRVQNSFKYFKDAFGVKPLTQELSDANHKHMFRVYESPFNYRKQTRLYMPMFQEDGSLFPTPPSPSAGPILRKEWVTAEAKEIQRLVAGSKGDTLVLCTSKIDLAEITAELDIPYLDSMGVTVVKQEGDAAYSHDQYMHTPNSVLFGLKSFWEGIDIVGPKLRMIIFPKLPFPTPEDPIIKALTARHKKIGDDSSFSTLFLSPMLIDMKQGAGRLIRSKTDKGVIAILDSRMWCKTTDPVKRARLLNGMLNGKTALDRFPKDYGGIVLKELRVTVRAKTFEDAIAFVNS